MMTFVTVLRDWKTRSLCLKWRRTESLTRGERKLSASFNFCNLNSRRCLIESTSNLFPLLCFNSKSVVKLSNVKHKLSFFPRICQKYEEITETIRSTPETTDALVALNQYIKKTSDVTIHKLIDEIDEAAYRLSFLLDYATLPCMWNLSGFFFSF